MGRSHRCFGSVGSGFRVGASFDGAAAGLRAMSASWERSVRRVSPITDPSFAIDSDAMATPFSSATPAQDAMPTTRGLNFYLEDRNFQLLCESVMDAETFARAAPHLTARGESAGEAPAPDRAGRGGGGGARRAGRGGRSQSADAPRVGRAGAARGRGGAPPRLSPDGGDRPRPPRPPRPG